MMEFMAAISAVGFGAGLAVAIGDMMLNGKNATAAAPIGLAVSFASLGFWLMMMMSVR